MTANESLAEAEKLLAIQRWSPEAIPLIRRAYELGATNEDTIKLLDKLYTRNGCWLEAGEWFEQIAASGVPWRKRVAYLRRAGIYFRLADDWQRCLSCHRKILSSLPEDATPQLRLDAWWPPGKVFSWVHCGVAQEAVSYLDRLGQTIDENDWSLYGRYVYHNCRALIHRELNEWSGVLKEANEFAQWAKSLSNDDPRLLRESEKIDPEIRNPLKGELGRLFCLCGCYAEKIIPAECKQGKVVSESFDELDRFLSEFEDLCSRIQQSTSNDSDDADECRKRVSSCFDKAGRTAYDVEEYTRAIFYFSRERELRNTLIADSPLYLSASLVALEKIDEAKIVLSKINGKLISNGLGLKMFRQLKEFDRIRKDPVFAGIVQNWN